VNPLVRQPTAYPSILVIGYGNPGRQDDELGPALALAINKLALSNVTVFDSYQLDIEDAVDVSEHDIVWFIDAACSGSEPYFIRDVSPAAGIEFTSHLVRPEVVLAIAQQLYGASPKAFLLGIRGYEFEFIEELTNNAEANLQAAYTMLSEQLCKQAIGSPK